MKFWIDHKYAITLEDEETEEDREAMEDIVGKGVDELDAAIRGAAESKGLVVRFTYD
jgi:hypothetical protein